MQYRPQIRRSQNGDVEREVGDQQFVAMKDETVRPEKTDRRAVLVDAAEVPEPGNYLAVLRFEHHDLLHC